MRQDFTHAVRMLLARPAYTIVAAAILAVGIGANTAIYSIVYTVLLKPLPYPAPDRIVQVFERSATLDRNSVSNPNFQDWRARATTFDAMAAYNGGTETVLGGSEAVFAEAFAVTGGFWSVFGVQPEIGRTFVAEEMRLGGVPAVVVSHGFWERTLGGQRDLSALRVIIGGQSARVVGVMPAGFAFPSEAEIWFPRELIPDDSGRTAHNLRVVARLKPDVSLAAAAAEMNTIAAQLKQQYGNDDNAIGATVVRLQEVLTGSSRSPLLLLVAAVALVLLIACANVAASMLARSEERRAEFAIRAALGAARRRLVRQLLVESLVLGGIGAVGGLLLAAWLLRVMTSTGDPAFAAAESIGLDGPMLIVALGLALLTPLFFGLLPALQASKGDLRDALTDAGRSAVAPARARVRAVLVTAEVTVALLLLVGALLLIRSFANVMSVDPGFNPRGAITARTAVPAGKYDSPERAVQFYDDLLTRLRALPGVVQAGATNQLPLSGDDFGGAFTFEGHPDEGAIPDGEYDGYKYSASYRCVTPGYLEALGVHLRRGRLLADSDRPGRAPVAVVNESFVRQFLPRADPIGVRFHYAGMDPVNPVFTIVGVIGDIHHRSLVRGSTPAVYVSLNQAPFRAQFPLTTVVRASEANLPAVGAAVREAVRQFDNDVPVRVSTLDTVLADSVADRRFLLLLLGGFALTALLLAATGIYSVLSRAVAQRTQEIGIRMALGAEPGRVVRLMIASAMTWVVAGVAAGTVAAVLASRLVESFLFGVRPLDPLAFAGAAALLVVVALVAGYVPARRATRVDPVAALRTQ